ncbi:MAG: hypothetical protein ACI4UA_02385 [Bacteroidaceae bacterium]
MLKIGIMCACTGKYSQLCVWPRKHKKFTPACMYPYERNKKSRAYISPYDGRGKYHYHMGSFNGAHAHTYLSMAHTLSDNIQSQWARTKRAVERIWRAVSWYF